MESRKIQPTKKVGTSSRTEGKHNLLNGLLANEFGCLLRLDKLNKLSRIDTKYVLVDMCAGDGDRSLESAKSSPEILISTASTIKLVMGIKTKVYFCEKDQFTFGRLKRNIESKRAYKSCPEDHILLNIDSRSLEDLPEEKSKNTYCFLHIDPNSIANWPLNPSLLQNCPRTTTLLVTLGCNAGGIKRLGREARDNWFRHLSSIDAWMPHWHGAFLIVLNNDKAQWAYLVVGPRSWAKEYKKIAEKSFSYWEHGITFIERAGNHEVFASKIKELFLTKKEFQNELL